MENVIQYKKDEKIYNIKWKCTLDVWVEDVHNKKLDGYEKTVTCCKVPDSEVKPYIDMMKDLIDKQLP